MILSVRRVPGTSGTKVLTGRPRSLPGSRLISDVLEDSSAHPMHQTQGGIVPLHAAGHAVGLATAGDAVAKNAPKPQLGQFPEIFLWGEAGGWRFGTLD